MSISSAKQRRRGLLWLLPLLTVCGCEPWSADGTYDPQRCDPACSAAAICENGACVQRPDSAVTQRDAGVDLRDSAVDLSDSAGDLSDSAVDLGADLLAPDIGLDAVPGTFVTINKGTFLMGSPSTEACREVWSVKETQHQVTLSKDFEIQQTEVTQEQFEAVMGYLLAFHGPNGGGASHCKPTCPVEYVNWHEAAAYCNALSAIAKLPSCYSCSGKGIHIHCEERPAYGGTSAQQIYQCEGYRLPTEAEWEYAYRAGTTAAFYSGIELDANTCAKPNQDPAEDARVNAISWNYFNATTPRPVAGRQPNAWGLYDMAGNVNEWCHDWHVNDLKTSAVTDPCHDGVGAMQRSVRGGSYHYGPAVHRAAMRRMGYPHMRGLNRGFRCARSLP